MASASGRCDAVVVGSGPNGLAAAITLARAGLSVTVLEGHAQIGGGLRSAELTRPGFLHDVCATIHVFGELSPFFRELPLQSYGLHWILPGAPAAHPLDDGTAVMAERSVDETAAELGADGQAYKRLIGGIADRWPALEGTLLGPFRIPAHPVAASLFGMHALRSAAGWAKSVFTGARARALFAGMAGHSILPLEQPPSAAVGLVLSALAHRGGWPIARGGSRQVAEALAAHLQSLGGTIRAGAPVASLEELPPSRAVLLDVTPRQLLRIAGQRLPAGYRATLARYRYGPGIFKVDWALDGPIPWTAADCGRAGTVHVGGTLEEIAESERSAWQGTVCERPFVLVTQPTMFDPGRAPEGRHIAWAYCHVPHGSAVDMTERIERQIERFAPGFRDRILARHTRSPSQYEAYNPNCIGGDITGGVQDLRQLFTRPAGLWDPYAAPVDGLYLCSSSTPPGGGVHGMCGLHAARSALRRVFGRVPSRS
jgi:phytoene dehydrogenase-like protein